ncbi:MAG: hypothetical protein ACRD23_04750 [Terriglobales bacterium]
MISKLGYDSYVKRLNSATVAALALGGLIFLASVSAAKAQINGTPASVTSINSGGHLNSTPGVRASVTSLGPNGLQPKNPFFNQPACCINPLFPVNPNPPLFPRRHQHRGQFFPAGGAVYVPYAYPVVVGETDAGDSSAEQEQNQIEEDDHGGPTIFDRRGPGTAARSYADRYFQRPSRAQTETEAAPAAPPAETPVPDQPQTLLVFKDAHQLEVQNYAVIGDTLYDLTPGRHHKIPLADLDLTSTAKQNDDRGIDFRLPPKPETNK